MNGKSIIWESMLGHSVAGLFSTLCVVVALMLTGCGNQDQAAVGEQSDDVEQATDAGQAGELAAADSDQSSDPNSQQGTTGANDQSGGVSRQQKALATKAKDELFEKLSGRLMEVMQSDGPAAAIKVCSQEAVQIAGTVGTEHGVLIGRTSFKLRNPANAPREWVKPFVEDRQDTPEFVALGEGAAGAIFPIHLNVKCLMCHGGPDDILDQVKTELAELYPNDAATGFKQGDLRGWFWVEVPPDAI